MDYEKEQKKSKLLYVYEHDFVDEDHKEIPLEPFQYRQINFMPFFIFLSAIIAFLTVVLFPEENNRIVGIFVFIVLVLYFRKLTKNRKKTFNLDSLNPEETNHIVMKFYTNCFSLTRIRSITTSYENITKVFETDSRFFMCEGDGKFSRYTIYILVKKDCNPELLDFLRKKLEKVTNQQEIDQTEEKAEKMTSKTEIQKKGKNPKIIQICSYLLAFVAIFSIFLKLYFSVRSPGVTPPEFLLYEFNSVFSLLPISIVCFLFGVVLYYKKLDGTLDILVGCITFLVIFFVGAFSGTYGTEHEYNEVKKFQEIVSVSLPTEGLYKTVSDGELSEKGYRKEEAIEIENNLLHVIWFSSQNESNTFLKKLKESELWKEYPPTGEEKNLILSKGKYVSCSVDHCYYSIYNKDSKEYQQYPEEKNDMYVMIYMPTYQTLYIEDYTYIGEDINQKEATKLID